MYCVNFSDIGLRSSTDDPGEVLDEYPLMTLKDVETNDVYDTDSWESLDDFLKESSFEFDLVLDPKKIVQKEVITDYNHALTVLNSKYINEGVKKLSKHLFTDKSNTKLFGSIIANSCYWNGDMNILPFYLNSNETMLLELYSSSRWNGIIGKDTKLDIKEVSLCIFTSPQWNGDTTYCHHSNISTVGMIETIVEHPNWNGSIANFSLENKKRKEFIKKVICSKWNGIVNYRIPLKSTTYNNIALLEEAIKSPKWDGDSSKFNNVFMSYRENIKTIIQHKNWKVNICSFNLDFIENSKEIMLEVIKHDNWNGNFTQFRQSFMNDEEFVESVIKNSKWDGDCRQFGDQILKSEDFLLKIIDSKCWNGDCSKFDSQVFKKPEIVRRLLNSSKWNGMVKNLVLHEYDDDLFNEIMSKPSVTPYLIIFHKNKMNRDFIRRLMNCSKWDGRVKNLDILQDDLAMLKEVVNHPSFNGIIKDGWFDNTVKL